MAALPATEIAYQALKVNFLLTWGDTWPLVFVLGTENSAGVFTPDNLTGATARLQIRDEANALKLDVVPVITPLTGTVDATQPYGSTKVDFDAAQYELELTYSDGTRRTEVSGKITVKGGKVADAP